VKQSVQVTKKFLFFVTVGQIAFPPLRDRLCLIMTDFGKNLKINVIAIPRLREMQSTKVTQEGSLDEQFVP
jgi:hypothetical protein